MTTAPIQPPSAQTLRDLADVRDRVSHEILRFIERSGGVQLIIVATADGRPLASHFSGGGDRNRMSAIVSSLLAVCETATREIQAGHCQSTIVCADEANVVIARIGGAHSGLVLAVVFQPELMLGMAVRTTQDLAVHIGQALRPTAAPPRGDG